MDKDTFRFVIITGMSGAGKTNFMQKLEDMGYYCVDNLPPVLIVRFADLCWKSTSSTRHVAVVTDIRGGSFFDALPQALDELEKRGIPHEVVFLEASDEAWAAVFDGLALSSVRTIRAALPFLRKAEWARIVNATAMSTKRQSPSLIAYTAAKSALTSLTKNLAQTLAPEGILVNTVSPGTFATASFKAALAEMPGVDENDLHDVMRFIGEGFGHHVFLDRAADPDEIGPVIAFAASARNTYMTGANINVDGGSDFT